jgi:hypothetical protein
MNATSKDIGGQDGALTLEERIQRLEDIEGVRDTWHDYLLTGDREGARSEAYADIFTEDAVVEMVGLDTGDGVWHGRRAVIEDFALRFDMVDTVEHATGHHGTNLRVAIDGDQATTIAYFFQIVWDGLVLAGTYEHRMQRDPDRWRIAFLRITVTYSQQVALVEPRTAFIRHPGPTGS